jgi:L-alanine-DL-glutamate epimerase-like enolase superfamily enzyme
MDVRHRVARDGHREVPDVAVERGVCGGLTELVRIDGLCGARNVTLSLRCAPGVSVHAGCALERLVHLEYFHDHVRLEGMLFEGTCAPHDGRLAPDLSRPGHGLELRQPEAAGFRV